MNQIQYKAVKVFPKSRRNRNRIYQCKKCGAPLLKGQIVHCAAHTKRSNKKYMERYYAWHIKPRADTWRTLSTTEKDEALENYAIEYLRTIG